MVSSIGTKCADGRDWPCPRVPVCARVQVLALPFCNSPGPRPFQHQGPTPVSMAQACVSASYHSCTSHPQGSQDASAVPGPSRPRPYPIYGQPAGYENWGASEEVVSYSETHSSVEGPSVDLSSLNSGSVNSCSGESMFTPDYMSPRSPSH